MTASIGMDSPSQGDDYYTVLGVAESATTDEIKRAYYKLVRQARPDDDPEAYHRFQTAGTVLADPRRRKEYDQLRDAGKRVEVLSDQAAAAAERDPQKAFGLLKAALAIAPDAPRPRLVLAHVLTRLNDYPGAERQYRSLLQDRPYDEVLHYRFARCLLVQERYENAEQVVGAAIRLNSKYHDAHMLLARIYEITGRFEPAIFALETAIENDGVEDYADLDALLRLLALHVRTENGDEAERTARRIMAILPAQGADDPTRQCERAAKRMLLRTRELASGGNIKAVRAFAALGSRLPNIAPETVAAFAQVAHESRLLTEAKRAQTDRSIPIELKQLAASLYLNRQAPAYEQEERRRNANDALMNATSQDAAQVESLLEYLRTEYPVFSEEHDALLSAVAVRVRRALLAPGDTLPVTDKTTAGGGFAGVKSIFGWLKGKK